MSSCHHVIMFPLFENKKIMRGNPNPFRYQTKAEKEQDAFNKCLSNSISLTLSIFCLFLIAYYEICDMHINVIFYIIALSSAVLNFMISDKNWQYYTKYVIIIIVLLITYL